MNGRASPPTISKPLPAAVEERGSSCEPQRSDDFHRVAWEGRNLTGHTDQVTALALGPSGRLFSSSMDGTVRAWDACRRGRSGEPPWGLQSEAKADVLQAHDKAVAAIGAGPDGRLLSGGWDHVACAWDRDWEPDDAALLAVMGARVCRARPRLAPKRVGDP